MSDDIGKEFDLRLEADLAELKSRIDAVNRQSLIPLPSAKGSLKKVCPEVQRSIALISPSLRKVIRSLITGESPWPLFLFGGVGTGKTCAALCLLDWGGGQYWPLPDLCEKILQAMAGRLEYQGATGIGGKVWPEKIWKGIHEAPLVILDEIGCRNAVSDKHYENLKTCLEERRNRPLVAISNLTPEEIGRLYDGRIFSRLSAGTIFEAGGPDRRIA